MKTNKSKSSKQDLLDCLLSVLDTLKLHDTDSLEETDETLSEMMFRKMNAYGIDLNKELGFTHLKPVSKEERDERINSRRNTGKIQGYRR